MYSSHAPTPWHTYHAGAFVLCPAPAKDRRASEHEGSERRVHSRTCDKIVRSVGAGLSVRVRVHPDGRAGQPNHCTTCETCKRCGTMLEFSEERVESRSTAA